MQRSECAEAVAEAGGGGGGRREVDRTRSVLDLFCEIICILFSLLVVDRGGGMWVDRQTEKSDE